MIDSVYECWLTVFLCCCGIAAMLCGIVVFSVYSIYWVFIAAYKQELRYIIEL